MKSEAESTVAAETRESAVAVFQPIVASHAFEEVVDQISHAVHMGDYEVGSRLPTVEALARAMEVSRPTVSEAVRMLERAGVLRVRRGAAGGIVVVSAVIPPSILKLSTRRLARDLVEIVEARRPVELAVARFAARRVTEEDLAVIRAALRLEEEALGAFAVWTFGNVKFHYAVGRAAHSGVLLQYQSELYKELAMFLEAFTPRDFREPEVTIEEHRAILAAIERRDEEAAVVAMDAHLKELEEFAEAMRGASPIGPSTRQASPAARSTCRGLTSPSRP